MYIIDGIIFGCISRLIAKRKGYDHGYGWGFWLGIVGMIVVVCWPDRNQYNSRNHEIEKEKPEKQETIVKSSAEYMTILKDPAHLYQEGVLTEEEYTNKKKEILSRI